MPIQSTAEGYDVPKHPQGGKRTNAVYTQCKSFSWPTLLLLRGLRTFCLLRIEHRSYYCCSLIMACRLQTTGGSPETPTGRAEAGTKAASSKIGTLEYEQVLQVPTFQHHPVADPDEYMHTAHDWLVRCISHEGVQQYAVQQYRTVVVVVIVVGMRSITPPLLACRPVTTGCLSLADLRLPTTSGRQTLRRTLAEAGFSRGKPWRAGSMYCSRRGRG